MKIFPFFCVIAGLGLAPAAVPTNPQEKHTIKINEQGEGDSWRFEITSQAFQHKEKALTGAGHRIYTDTVLAREAGVGTPTKVKRVYEKALGSIGGTGGKLVESSFHSRTLLIEKKGKKYDVSREDGGPLK